MSLPQKMPPTLHLTPLPSLRISKHLLPAKTSPTTGRVLIPNTSIQNYPLLHYHSAFTFTFPSTPGSPPQAGQMPSSSQSSSLSPSSSATVASQIEAHLRSVGVVEPQWRYGMYSTTHFHSTTHEVLCIYSGRARLLFGGESDGGLVDDDDDDDDATKRQVEVVVGVGDVVVVPGGVGHRLLEELDHAVRSGDGGRRGGGKRDKFLMVGSYPVGAEGWDMCYGRDDASAEEIKEERGKMEGIKGLGWMVRDPVYGDQGPVVDVAREKAV